MKDRLETDFSGIRGQEDAARGIQRQSSAARVRAFRERRRKAGRRMVSLDLSATEFRQMHELGRCSNRRLGVTVGACIRRRVDLCRRPLLPAFGSNHVVARAANGGAGTRCGPPSFQLRSLCAGHAAALDKREAENA